MRIRRCAILLLEPRERVEFDLELLLQGGSGVRSRQECLALAPHLDAAVVIDAEQRELLAAVGDAQWRERSALEGDYRPTCLDELLRLGLLIGDGDEPLQAHWRARDEKLRDTGWHPLAAVSHYFNRWRDVDAEAAAQETGLSSNAELAARQGVPPPHFHQRADAVARIALQRPEPGPLDRLLWKRATCRNYDRARALDAASFTRLLHTVYAAQATQEITPESAVVKKTSPSGGGLHPTEIYLLVQQVEGVAPGLYHYHAGEHALERLTTPIAPDGAAEESAALHTLARRLVAGQHWFADAHVLVMLVPRFRRSYWKYRNHAKAYRALALDVGHLSQTLYVAATELGLGAFVTSAINEVEIERVFGLDALDESPLAVCGFGWRAAGKVTLEFDPLQQVWG